MRLLRQLIIMGLLVGVGTAMSQCHAATRYVFGTAGSPSVYIPSDTLDCQSVFDGLMQRWNNGLPNGTRYYAKCAGVFTTTVGNTKTGAYQSYSSGAGPPSSDVALTIELKSVDSAAANEQQNDLHALVLLVGGALAFGLGFLGGK